MDWVIALTSILCVLDVVCLAQQVQPQQVQPQTPTNINGNLSNNVSSHQRTQLNVPSKGYDKVHLAPKIPR